MGRSPCCEKDADVVLKKGPWAPEEDKLLVAYIGKNGHGSWRRLPKLAGLNRCCKSCRLRWTNYLCPDIKRGDFTEDEERLIIHLHATLGNKWSSIAKKLKGRTDNEIKNHWNTHLRKKLLNKGIDPATHRPITDVLAAAQHINAIKLIQDDAAKFRILQSLFHVLNLPTGTATPVPAVAVPSVIQQLMSILTALTVTAQSGGLVGQQPAAGVDQRTPPMSSMSPASVLDSSVNGTCRVPAKDVLCSPVLSHGGPTGNKSPPLVAAADNCNATPDGTFSQQTPASSMNLDDDDDYSFKELLAALKKDMLCKDERERRTLYGLSNLNVNEDDHQF